ncbi:GNAT family N-acetyltransferase [Nonomuraea sp. NPDC046570]|uniref:GNAT family N-acetyltransferase n=1 Tax=Nonomuraea sp. NPDC046570 TaxID=3155255 RepID=UPI0033D1B3BB
MWTISPDAEVFAKHAEAFLAADPVANTVPLTVLANLRAGLPAEGAYFAWWTDSGEVRGAAFRTPPHPLCLARTPLESIGPLTGALRRLGTPIPEVTGPVELTEAFTAEWGEPVGRVISERLYCLGTLGTPEVAGVGRVAGAADFGLLASWYQAFAAETGLNLDHDLPGHVRLRLERGDLRVWTVDGVPVSMAGVSLAAAGMCRIGPVYTPPSCRRRGYGAAVTAYASRVALDERADRLVLFTDLDNPTSNAIYQAVGYEPVSDYAHVVFEVR